MEKKTIPHEHLCTVCKRPEGCEEVFCDRPLWDVCSTRPECQQIYIKATVHRYTDGDTLPCCERRRVETPGDRMTTDLSRVTCKGKEQKTMSDGEEEVPTLPAGVPGHVVGCLCAGCIAANQEPIAHF